MKPPKPLPTEPPFLTLYTNTRLRPEALRRNLESVGRQTAVERLEQLVIPDHVGYGLAGALFGRVPWYAEACRGRYVAFLSDDDALAGENVVAALERFVGSQPEAPAAVLVRVAKGDGEFPKGDPAGPPVEGEIDLGCYVLRRDVWVAYKGAYGMRYSGDYDHAKRLWDDGIRPLFADVLFAAGPLSNGRPEMSL
jgi:hypothetical protein